MIINRYVVTEYVYPWAIGGWLQLFSLRFFFLSKGLLKISFVERLQTRFWTSQLFLWVNHPIQKHNFKHLNAKRQIFYQEGPAATPAPPWNMSVWWPTELQRIYRFRVRCRLIIKQSANVEVSLVFRIVLHLAPSQCHTVSTTRRWRSSGSEWIDISWKRNADQASGRILTMICSAFLLGHCAQRWNVTARCVANWNSRKRFCVHI